jgi:FkbM family methyltransferase
VSKSRVWSVSVVKLVLTCGIVSVLTVLVHRELLKPHFFFSTGALRELQVLEPYGLTNRVSRNFEELIIRHFFDDKKNGTFLDVGASHYQKENNTYYLEKTLGWSGVAVEALAEYGDGYKQNRPRTRFVAMFASDVAESKVQFFVSAKDDKTSSATPDAAAGFAGSGQARTVPTTTLNTVLDQAGITRLDFMSMDIELAEPKALAGLDIDRFRPALVCIESHPHVRQQILDYFAAHDYVVIGQYLRIDPHNLYFTPQGYSEQAMKRSATRRD